MYHIYRWPVSARGQECADLVAAMGQNYEVHVVRTPDDIQEIPAKGRKPNSFPQVFADPGDTGSLEYIGGLRSLRKWVAEDTTERGRIPPMGEPPWEAMGGIPGRFVRAQEVRDAMTVVTRGRDIQLYHLDSHTYVLAPKHFRDVAAMALTDTRVPSCENGRSDHIAFYLAGLFSLRFGINSCGVLVDTTSGRIYNLVWVDDMGCVRVKAFDPGLCDWVELGEHGYRANSGFVILG